MRIAVEIICGRPGRDPFGTARIDERTEIDVARDAPHLTLAVGRAVGGELEAIGKQREERIAPIRVVRERRAQVRELGARRRLDLLHELRQLGGRLLRRQDLRFELLDASRTLAQLGDQLGNVVGHRDRLGESLLLRTHVAQLRFERGDVGLTLGQLRLDLLADLGEHFVEYALRQHVPRDVLHQCAFHVVHALVHGHRAHGAAALVVPRTRVDPHALLAAAVHARARREDRAAAVRALRDTAERVLRLGTTYGCARTARGETLLRSEPDIILHDAPLGHVDREHLVRIRLRPDRRATAANLLDSTVHVDAAIARVQQHGADRTRCPRPATAASSGWRAHALRIQDVRDRLDAVIIEEHLEDPTHDVGLRLVDDRDRVATSRPIALAFERVAETRAARDATFTHARAQCFTCARADRFQLHLMTGALDERGRLIDRVREQHLLAGHVIEQAATAIAHQVADHERHFDRVTTETRLITAHDHVPRLRVGE